MRVIKNLFFLIFILMSFSINAQKNVTHQNLIWYTYFQQIQINKNWSFNTDLQERTFINPYTQHQFLIRSHITRNIINGFSLSTGFCYFLQDNNDPTLKDKLSIPELRPYVDLNQKQKFKYLTIDHRFRTEFRFNHHLSDSKKSLEKGYSFSSFRFRYLIQFSIPIVKIADKQFLKVKLSDELLLNAGKNISKNIFDQNRIYVALSIDLLPSLTLETGYIYWYQQRNTGIDFYSRNIFRFGILHNITCNKKVNKKLSTK